MNQLVFLLISIFLINTSKAQPVLDCGLSLSVDNVTFSWNGSSQIFTGNITAERTNNSNNCRNMEIGFSTGVAGNYNRAMESGGTQVAYNLYKDNSTNNPLKTINDANNNSERIRFRFKNNVLTENLTFEARLPVPNLGRTNLPTGSYNDLITATIEPRRNNAVSSSVNFQVSLNLPPEIDISLVSPGGIFDPSQTNYTMNFNVISQGDSRQVDLKVKSNAGYSLSLSSQNGGALKHLTANYNIPYQLRVNGTPRSFSGAGVPLVIGTGTGNTPAQGVNFALSVEVGDPNNKLAGNYEDVITVTATSN